MIQCTISTKKISEQTVQGYIFLLPEDFTITHALADISKKVAPHLEQLIKHHEFKGGASDVLVVQGYDTNTLVYLVLVGLGKETKETNASEVVRQAIARALRAAESRRLATLSVQISDIETTFLKLSPEYTVQTIVEAALMSIYSFEDFITCQDAKIFKVKELVILVSEAQRAQADKALNHGVIIGSAVNQVRHWVDMPANRMTPDVFVEKAREVAKTHSLECTVFDEKKIESLGMGGLKAVGMASHYDPYLVILHYKTKKQNAPTIAFVGKGITFDSGGLNLKPGAFMDTMKEDMAGAAAVVNVIAALAQLQVDVNIVALAPIAENMISGLANHPGDIVTFYNGKTAIIGNTDAEGRLVLADALAYATKHYDLAAIIDVATLTGAVSHAVGPYFSGLLTQNEEMAERVFKAAQTSGDHVWRLPLIDAYKKMVKADIADICNDGKTKYYAGPTNGACFLSHFVGTIPWAHLDIASAAFDVPDIPYYRSGATGAGTRLLIDVALQWETKI